jgi:hypothetical protein
MLYSIAAENKRAFHARVPKHPPTGPSHDPHSIGIEMYQWDIATFENDADFTDWVRYGRGAGIRHSVPLEHKKEMVMAHKKISTHGRAGVSFHRNDRPAVNERIARLIVGRE